MQMIKAAAIRAFIRITDILLPMFAWLVIIPIAALYGISTLLVVFSAALVSTVLFCFTPILYCLGVADPYFKAHKWFGINKLVSVYHASCIIDRLVEPITQYKIVYNIAELLRTILIR